MAVSIIIYIHRACVTLMLIRQTVRHIQMPSLIYVRGHVGTVTNDLDINGVGLHKYSSMASVISIL